MLKMKIQTELFEQKSVKGDILKDDISCVLLYKRIYLG